VKLRTLVPGLFLLVLLAPVMTAQARNSASPHLAAVINLQKVLKDKTAARVEAGGGVSLKLIAADGAWRQNLIIFADGRKLKELKGGRFLACARVAADPVTYWAISEYTGGAHCCGRFIFLAQAAPGQQVRYWGKTTGYNGGPRDFPGSFKERQGQLYFESFDDRFDYFHTSHADSMLVNVPRFYYRLSPTALSVDNLPFKDVYLKRAAAVDREIQNLAKRRSRKPEAILCPGFGPGFKNLVFSDDLGQLLVKRTIYFLYAREDRRAWQTLKQGVAHFYGTSAWVPQLQQEIETTLHARPY
jgi:hypothetical protein